jgi:hypothetical protein
MRPAVTADGGATRTRDISDKSDKSRRAAGFGRLCRVFIRQTTRSEAAGKWAPRTIRWSVRIRLTQALAEGVSAQSSSK